MNLGFKYFRLQQIDSQLDRARSRIEAIDSILADQSAINQASKELENARNILEMREKELRSCENETASQRSKIKESEQQLYGGKVTNPKELQDLQRELEALRRHLEVLEDRQLEAMIAMEEAQTDAGTARTGWTNVQAREVERNAALLGEHTQLLAEVERLEEERGAASKSLEFEEIETYNRLRRVKNGVAVAHITDKTCSACGSTLTAALIQTAQSPNELTRCPTCGRFLYGG